MAFGTIYTHNPNPRTTAILVLAKAQGLDLNVVYADRADGEGYDELLKINPLGQVPIFVAPDGWVLSECIPITLYVASQSDTTTLLGSTRRDYYDIVRWMSFVNCDFMPAIGGCILPLIGRRVKIHKDTNDCLRAMYEHCDLTNDHLTTNRYLVGDKLTVADVFMTSLLFGLFKVFHPVVHEKYPSLTRWFYEVYDMPMFKGVVGEFEHVNLDYPKLSDDESGTMANGKGLETGKLNGKMASA
ncbi:glutathione S-transferase [Xylariaceae sp. FL0255]|nr:glutathione S-transferase [Xylariaceae sp. FL0255]